MAGRFGSIPDVDESCLEEAMGSFDAYTDDLLGGTGCDDMGGIAVSDEEEGICRARPALLPSSAPPPSTGGSTIDESRLRKIL